MPGKLFSPSYPTGLPRRARARLSEEAHGRRPSRRRAAAPLPRTQAPPKHQSRLQARREASDARRRSDRARHGARSRAAASTWAFPSGSTATTPTRPGSHRQTIYVSPTGSGDGATREHAHVGRTTRSRRRGPARKIHFMRGSYQGCFEFTKENSGTYDEPIVLYGERNADKSLGVAMTLLQHRAADLLQLRGGRLRRGRRLRADRRQLRRARDRRRLSREPALARHRGASNCNGHDQDRDPFFSGQSDWAVWERNVALRRQEGRRPRHLSQQRRRLEHRPLQRDLFGTLSSDFQINADPASTCKEAGIPFNDPRCDAYAGTGEGGQGASDYFLVDGNYFHHSAGGRAELHQRAPQRRAQQHLRPADTAQRAASGRRPTIRSSARSENKILHNLFITTERHGVQVREQLHPQRVRQQRAPRRAGRRRHGRREPVRAADGGRRHGRRECLPLQSLRLGHARRPHSRTRRKPSRADFSPGWFANFPTALNRNPNDFTPTASAPFLGQGHPLAATRRPTATAPRAPARSTSGRSRCPDPAIGPGRDMYDRGPPQGDRSSK